MNRKFKILICAGIMAASGVGAYFMHQQLTSEYAYDFNERSYLAVNRLAERLNDYQDILFMGQAFLHNSSTITQAKWDQFYRDEGIYQRYKGISSIAYVKLVSNQQLPSFLKQMRSDPAFGAHYTVSPSGNRSEYGLMSYYSSNNNISSSFGFDVLSDPIRKNIYEQASSSGQPATSAPLQFKTGYEGVFTVLAYKPDGVHTDGYLVLSFRFNDLFNYLFQTQFTHLQYQLTDTTAKQPVAIFSTRHWAERRGPEYGSDVKFGSRTWHVTTALTRWKAIWVEGYIYPAILIALGVLACLVVAPRLRSSRRDAVKSKSIK